MQIALFIVSTVVSSASRARASTGGDLGVGISPEEPGDAREQRPARGKGPDHWSGVNSAKAHISLSRTPDLTGPPVKSVRTQFC